MPRRFVPAAEALAAFATAPTLDPDEIRRDLDAIADQEIRDPFEGTDS